MTGRADRKKNRFAAIPLRALRDSRLSARHLRVLGIVAAHDQMDRNGAGCWAAQRRLAKLASCGEARLSDTISDLRDFGYLKSHKNPQRVHQRVHRIIYNDQDSRWDQDVSRTFPIGKAAKSGNFPNREKELSQSGKNTTVVTREKCPNDAEFWQNPSLRTYVQTDKKDNKGNGIETDCAEARSQGTVTEAENYLANCEALAASDDRQILKFEREKIEQLADDACMPESVNEQATKLLGQI
jgi:hypothetical protein